MPDSLDITTRGLFTTTGLSVTTRGLLSAAGPVHARAGIRQQIVKILKAEASAEQRVFESRKLPLQADLLPAILVYTLDEDAEKFAESPRTLLRTVKLAVEIVASAIENPLLDEQLDAIAHLVEVTVSADRFLAGRSTDLMLASTQIAFSDEGDREHMSARLLFNVEYTTEFSQLAGEDLNVAHAGWDLAAPDGQKEAEDKLTYP